MRCMVRSKYNRRRCRGVFRRFIFGTILSNCNERRVWPPPLVVRPVPARCTNMAALSINTIPFDIGFYRAPLTGLLHSAPLALQFSLS